MSAEELGQVCEVAGEGGLVFYGGESFAVGDVAFRERVEDENARGAVFWRGIGLHRSEGG